MDISFLIPVYNAGRFIEDCIRSVAAQGLESYEILAMNDCSKDDSYEKLQGLCRIYPHLRVYRNAENSGVSYTRNRLIEMACGQYVSFVDADDMLTRGSIKQFLTVARAHDADYVSGNMTDVPEDARFDPAGESVCDVPAVRMNRFDLASPHDTVTDYMRGVITAGILRRDFILNHHLRFREDLHRHEDTMFAFEASLVPCIAYHCPVPCYNYRTNSTSLTHTQNANGGCTYYRDLCYYTNVFRTYTDAPAIPDEMRERARIEVYRLQQQLMLTLCRITDPPFVKAEMQKLKKDGLYPYRGRKELLSKPSAKRLVLYMMHSEPAWRLMHALYCLKAKLTH